jgi:hypothetical protein
MVLAFSSRLSRLNIRQPNGNALAIQSLRQNKLPVKIHAEIIYALPWPEMALHCLSVFNYLKPGPS